MAKYNSLEARPNLDRVPRIKGRPLFELPDDHLLRALAYIASSRKGLTGKYATTTTLPPMHRYADALHKLQADTRGLHTTAAGRDRARVLADIAIVELGDLCTNADRDAGRLRARIEQRHRTLTAS